MSITFTKSANGEATCSFNSIRLHSAYNPSREAERFVQNVKCDFNPKYILITGAALVTGVQTCALPISFVLCRLF